MSSATKSKTVLKKRVEQPTKKTKEAIAKVTKTAPTPVAVVESKTPTVAKASKVVTTVKKTKTTAKPLDSTAEPKVPEISASKSEPETTTKPKPKTTESKTDPKLVKDTKPEAKPAPKTKPTAKAEPSKATPKTDSEGNTTAKAKPEAKPEPKAITKAKPEAKVESKSKAKTVSKVVPAPEPSPSTSTSAPSKKKEQVKPTPKPVVAAASIDEISPATARALAAAANVLQAKRQQHSRSGKELSIGSTLKQYQQLGTISLDDGLVSKQITQIASRKRKQPSPITNKNGDKMRDGDDGDDYDDDDESDDIYGTSYDPELHDIDIYGEGQDDLEELTSQVLDKYNVRTEEDDLEEQELDKRIKRPDMNNNMNQRKIKRQKVMELDKEKRDSKERLQRTLFIGNVSINTKESDIKRLLAPLEVKIESIRFRGATFATTKLPRWVSFARGEFNQNRDTMNAFVVLDTEEMAQKCLQIHKTELHGKHLRVDIAANEGKIDHNLGVFVGNLPFDITEETLFKIFSQQCNNDVDQIRCVRDKKTGMGKGFAFVTFTEKINVTEALRLHETTPSEIGRAIRVVKIPPNAFDKTESFKTQLLKNRLRAEQQRKFLQAQKQSELRKKQILGRNYKPPTQEQLQKMAQETSKKVKIQGAFQRTFQSNSAVSGSQRIKKPRHQPRNNNGNSSLPSSQSRNSAAIRRTQQQLRSWMGTTAREGDGIGRNKKTNTNPHKKRKVGKK